MNSVTQPKTRTDIVSREEGTGKELFALFCCSLFALTQLFFLFDFSQNTSQRKIELQVVNGHKLVLNDWLWQNSFESENPCLSVEQLNFSPFFFLPVAINHCDKLLLMSVKGIGTELAEKILQTRNQFGPFETAEDLLRVSGIGPVRMAQIAPYLSFVNYYE